ncbi:NTP transferase domain-containing protein [Bacillus sp. FJAT-50079]|uniref:NTP transferase domain-containing protein n=1 Tax=Bacillus sp. FJAT-50079 TaxID=2833577 RepID=UPI001BC920B3|nr:NTP transferase domain-containing protein [Bacillus sp. FJAT-50079]MBS4210268.1 NTP transferase domain-containing protein [Bacillus sp. FJAT-50079]
MKVAGIYLAAGSSRRMGKYKLSLPTQNGSLGSLALKTALKTSLDQIFIITRKKRVDEWLPPELFSHKKCVVVDCPTAHLGQSESLKCGIKQVEAIEAEAAMIMLADQPLITAAMLEELLTIMRKKKTTFVAASFNEVIMPPVLFSASMYPQLLHLQGDKGARALLKGEFLTNGQILPFTEKELFFDIDTDEEYETLLSLMSSFVWS